MTIPLDCERARRGFADCLDDAVPATLAAHLAGCPECADELRALAAVLETAVGAADRDVPDPGEAYWDGFLPSVRSRIAGRTVGRFPRPGLARAAAAAVLMIGVALASLSGIRHPSDAPGASDPARRLEAAATRVSVDLSGPGILEVTLGEAIDPDAALSALQDMAPIPGDDLWDDPEILGLIEGLDDRTVEKLKLELSDRRG